MTVALTIATTPAVSGARNKGTHAVTTKAPSREIPLSEREDFMNIMNRRVAERAEQLYMKHRKPTDPSGSISDSRGRERACLFLWLGAVLAATLPTNGVVTMDVKQDLDQILSSQSPESHSPLTREGRRLIRSKAFLTKLVIYSVWRDAVSEYKTTCSDKTVELALAA